MISPISITDKYILQPTLLNKHQMTLEWLSAAMLWKQELGFFQKLIDEYAPKYSGPDELKQVDHFKNLINYYNRDLIDSIMQRLRSHENKLAEMLRLRDETKTEYFAEHDDLMSELESLNNRFAQIKLELFLFIETAMKK